MTILGGQYHLIIKPNGEAPKDTHKQLVMFSQKINLFAIMSSIKKNYHDKYKLLSIFIFISISAVSASTDCF